MVRDYGLCLGIHILYFGDDTAPDHKKYRRFLRKSTTRVYVYLHPQLPNFERLESYGFSLAGPGLGFTVDTVITITRMIMSGIFDELPNLRVVLGHLGEGIPFLIDRMENRVKFIPNDHMKQKKPLGYYFKNNIWYQLEGICPRNLQMYNGFFWNGTHYIWNR